MTAHCDIYPQFGETLLESLLRSEFINRRHGNSGIRR